MPENTSIVGYARSKLTVNDIREKSKPWVKVRSGEEALVDQFWAANTYVAGGYDAKRDFELLNQEISRLESKKGKVANRLFYLALPPSVFDTVTSHLKDTCMSPSGISSVFTRSTVELPSQFTRNLGP